MFRALLLIIVASNVFAAPEGRIVVPATGAEMQLLSDRGQRVEWENSPHHEWVARVPAGKYKIVAISSLLNGMAEVFWVNQVTVKAGGEVRVKAPTAVDIVPSFVKIPAELIDENISIEGLILAGSDKENIEVKFGRREQAFDQRLGVVEFKILLGNNGGFEIFLFAKTPGSKIDGLWRAFVTMKELTQASREKPAAPRWRLIRPPL
jgi:hypothetical protein